MKQLSIKTASLDTPVGDLSGGNQQKVSVARWLATEPKLLILDEPTQGIDVGAKAEIHRLMGELAGRGMAILMISSELPEILGMSDRIVVMHGGTVVGHLGSRRGDARKSFGVGIGSCGNRQREHLMARYKREISMALAYLVLLGVLAVFAPRFYQGDKFLNILVASAPVLVAAVGMTLVILSRNIDISIGSQLSICGVVAGLLAKTGLPMPLVALSTMAVGASMGALNGLFVATVGSAFDCRDAGHDGDFSRSAALVAGRRIGEESAARFPMVRSGAKRRAVGDHRHRLVHVRCFRLGTAVCVRGACRVCHGFRSRCRLAGWRAARAASSSGS